MNELFKRKNQRDLATARRENSTERAERVEDDAEILSLSNCKDCEAVY